MPARTGIRPRPPPTLTALAQHSWAASRTSSDDGDGPPAIAGCIYGPRPHLLTSAEVQRDDPNGLEPYLKLGCLLCSWDDLVGYIRRGTSRSTKVASNQTSPTDLVLAKVKEALSDESSEGFLKNANQWSGQDKERLTKLWRVRNELSVAPSVSY
ncbi:hypothetical protein NDU88_002848 [Pleurodeles waltl]|uniref:Uncharacterized protein n=1 Tax=Pleurodeles waltl TaxID=8319 RepID=A0AAV7M1U3_PLEWA|nr:hypothetical protein NDU88_002848 [Pleurodeles waltl]